MDIILYIVVGIICFLAGRVNAPKETVTISNLSDKERKEHEYTKNLNESLLSEVQQLRSLENQLRGQLWEAKQKLKKSQQKN
jgi:hypothetical protein